MHHHTGLGHRWRRFRREYRLQLILAMLVVGLLLLVAGFLLLLGQDLRL